MDAARDDVFGLHIPFLELIGIEPISSEPGLVTARLEVRPELLNSWGVAHGGVTMTLLDFVMGAAARSTDAGAHAAVTVEMKTSFFAPATGTLTVQGRVLHASTTLHYCEAELRDAQGKLVAKALGTFKLLWRR